MASLCRDVHGGWRVLFCGADDKRYTIRLGRCARKTAETCKAMIERLIETRRLGTALDGPTAAWVHNLDGTLRDRLRRVGLLQGPPQQSIEKFLNDYIDQRQRRGDVADGTIRGWKNTVKQLLDFFGPDNPLHAITSADAERWAAWLRADCGLAENTVRRRCGWAKQFFSVAVRHKLISENPFSGLVCAVRPVPERRFFVDRDMVARVLEQLPGAEWRLLFLLARFQGLRLPSEIRDLRWSDVNWDSMTMVIHSPKTARHKGREKRICPIFPEVQEELRAAFDEAPPGSEWVLPVLRITPVPTLRFALCRAITRAGLVVWPRLFTNLRSSRATELADAYPSHVASAWLGHTEVIADAHYRQVTATHLLRATTEATGDIPWAAQKAAQHPAAPVYPDVSHPGREDVHLLGETVIHTGTSLNGHQSLKR
jgi:integrase